MSDLETAEDAAKIAVEQVLENANWDFTYLGYVYNMDESTSTPFAV